MEEITMSSANNDLKSSKRNTGQQPEEVEDESSLSDEEDDGDTLSLSDPHDSAVSTHNTPFNLDYSFEFFTGPNNPKEKANDYISKAGDIVFFGTAIDTPASNFNQEQGREDGEEQEDEKESSQVRITSTNPFEDEKEEVVVVIEENSERNPNDVLLPLSSARLLNEVILRRATITTTSSSSSPTRHSSYQHYQNQPFPVVCGSLARDLESGGGGGYKSKKKHNKVLLGLAKIAPKMELGGHKKNRQIKNRHSGLPAAPLFSAVVADNGGPISSGSGGGSWGHVRALRLRYGSRLANLLTKASFGCIRLP